MLHSLVSIELLWYVHTTSVHVIVVVARRSDQPEEGIEPDMLQFPEITAFRFLDKKLTNSDTLIPRRRPRVFE